MHALVHSRHASQRVEPRLQIIEARVVSAIGIKVVLPFGERVYL
jgi:hypothetical protein